MENENAYLISHNGLGDNITMIGAVNFLLKFYTHIFFLCKEKFAKNVALLFINKPVTIISFNNNAEFTQPEQILSATSNDIFVCGFAHTNLFKYRKITKFKYEPDDKHYKINNKWHHIKDFYTDAKMDLSIYYEYFDITSTVESQQYYEDIKKYRVIFTHTKASDSEIQIPHVTSKYINDDNTIIICANKNVYPENHPKYELANKYINIPITHYIDIIKNASEIHVVDSCFSCIVNPLQHTNRLSATDIIIYERTPTKINTRKNTTIQMQFD